MRQVGARVFDAVLLRHLTRLVELAADQRDHFDAVNVLDAVQVFDAKRTGSDQRHVDRLAHVGFSKIKCPTAVLLAGT